MFLYQPDRSTLKPDTRRAVDATVPHDAQGKVYFYRTWLGGAGMDYLLEKITETGKLDDVKELELRQCDLTDIDAPAICALIRSMPNLTSLELSDNGFTEEGLKPIVEALKERAGLLTLRLDNNHTAPELGKTIAEALPNWPKLRTLMLSKMNLGDEGVTPILNAISAKHGLHAFHISDNRATAISGDAFLTMLQRQPNITNIGFVHGDINENTRIAEAIAAQQPRNLLSTYPWNEGTQTLTRQNTESARKAAAFLMAPPEHLTVQELAFVDDHLPAAIRTTYNLRPPAQEELMQNFISYVESLPQMSRTGEDFTKSLFTLNANGHAPLDNPRLWQDSAQTNTAMTHLRFSRDVLAARTPKSTGLLDSLALHIPLEPLLGALNKQGVQLGCADLLDKNNRPNALLRQWTESGEVASLFTLPNWQGKSGAELTRLHDALPQEWQQRIPVNALRQKLRPQPSPGVGR